MSDLSFNKVAGALLATGLAIVGLHELSSGVFGQEKVEKPGYLVEVAAEEGGGAAAADVPIDWGTVLPKADIAAGEAVFAKCKSCHNADQGGANGTGPNLYGVEGRKPGSHPGFAYSPAMTDLGGKVPQWDFEHLNSFISGPQKYLNGTKMTFVGLKKPEDRINVLAYLHSKGGTLAFPAPNPAAAAGAPAPSAPTDAAAPAAGAAGAGQPTTGGATATPTAGAGGPSTQGKGAPGVAAAPNQVQAKPAQSATGSDAPPKQ